MSKSNTEIAAEVFGAEWSEQPDTVRAEWEEFVAAYRDGVSCPKDRRAVAVKRAMGIADAYMPSGEDAVKVGIAPAPKKKPAPKKGNKS